MGYFGHILGVCKFQDSLQKLFKGFAQSIHNPKGTYLQILSEIGEIHLHTYFGILRHALLNIAHVNPLMSVHTSIDPMESLRCEFWNYHNWVKSRFFGETCRSTRRLSAVASNNFQCDRKRGSWVTAHVILDTGNVRSERDMQVDGSKFPCLRHWLARRQQFKLESRFPGVSAKQSR